MEKVPPEVLSSILRYLDVRTSYHRDIPNPTWPKYVTVCRKWQHQIERFSFNEVLLTRDRMADAQNILTRQCLGYVRTIELGIRLPSYDEEARTRLENEEEKRCNNEVFTRTVDEFFSFFEALGDCAPDNRLCRGLELFPDSLEKVKLQYTYPPPNNHDFAPARVSADIDKLSVALRALCQRVKSADVEASVTSDFFWPSSTTGMEPGALEPRQEWPHLQFISLIAAEADPNGNWLCDRHCKYGAVDAAGVQEEREEVEEDQEGEEEDEDYLRNGEPDTPADEDRRENHSGARPTSVSYRHGI
ncbi:hypothetical protein PG995_007737 [Apiospora arundinis]